MAEATEVQPDTAGPSALGSWLRFLTSSVGAKVLMALTGAFLWVFLCGHLAGNLLLYVGRDTFNGYASTLHHNPALVWAVRLGMIVSFPLHVLTAIRASQLNMAARPVSYAYGNKAPARLSATTMVLSGLVVAAFFFYHLAHFTWRVTGPQPYSLLPSGDWDAYTMVVMGFSQPLISAFYVLAVGLLSMHLSHGLYSMFQHLGMWGSRWTRFLNTAALVVGFGMCAAFASLPVAVFLGVIKP